MGGRSPPYPLCAPKPSRSNLTVVRSPSLRSLTATASAVLTMVKKRSGFWLAVWEQGNAAANKRPKQSQSRDKARGQASRQQACGELERQSLSVKAPKRRGNRVLLVHKTDALISAAITNIRAWTNNRPRSYFLREYIAARLPAKRR